MKDRSTIDHQILGLGSCGAELTFFRTNKYNEIRFQNHNLHEIKIHL